MGDRVGTFSQGDIEHALGDAGAGDRGAEQVAAFVDRAGLDHREDVVGGEVLLEVADEALRGAGGEGLLLEAVELVALADVGAVGDDFSVVLFLEPEKEHGGIQTSGVGDDDFHAAGGQHGGGWVKRRNIELPTSNFEWARARVAPGGGMV